MMYLEVYCVSYKTRAQVNKTVCGESISNTHIRNF